MENYISEDHIQSVISATDYIVMSDGRTTVCHLTLRNGFTVLGSSACVSVENFNRGTGQELALKDATEKVRVLEGYLLHQKFTKRTRITATTGARTWTSVMPSAR